MKLSASLLAGGDDTIVAIATAGGRGALATLRLSGARATAIARALGASRLTPRKATRVLLKHPVSGEPLDDALVTAFLGPASYTGEDCVELSTHGGKIAPRIVLSACIAAGARLALPGEFTRRAVLNGRISLLQAEAIGELIDAPTSALHSQALMQLDGALSDRFIELRNSLLHLEALIAYDIDFPEEDDGPIDKQRIASAIDELQRSLQRLLESAPRANVLREGALVVIAGPPNAGKSSLFNALLGEARALVTPVAGTTRDAIEAVLDTPVVPLRLVDTAGIRETEDEIERLGIEIGSRYLASAHAVLACGENHSDIDATVAAASAHTEAPILRVHTKSDLHAANDDANDGVTTKVSSTSGEGLAELLKRTVAAISGQDEVSTGGESGGGGSPGTEAGAGAAAGYGGKFDIVVLRERQRAGIQLALDEVSAFEQAWRGNELPAIVAAVHLQAAALALDSVIGDVSVEDILDRVFREFCVGK